MSTCVSGALLGEVEPDVAQEQERAQLLVDDQLPEREDGGALPPEPPLLPPRRGRPGRPPRPPFWRRVLLWAAMLIIAWIVGAALGLMLRHIEARWERDEGDPGQ